MLFYHVSKTDHGPFFKFKPKLPEKAVISKEGNIPRVCVTPEIFYCLRSIASGRQLYSMDIIIECRNKDNTWTPPTVYMTPREPLLPPRVSDFRKNHEHWFIEPIKMVRMGYIDLVALTKGKVELIQEFRHFTFDEIGGEGKDVPIRERNNLSIGRRELDHLIYMNLED